MRSKLVLFLITLNLMVGCVTMAPKSSTGSGPLMTDDVPAIKRTQEPISSYAPVV